MNESKGCGQQLAILFSGFVILLVVIRVMQFLLRDPIGRWILILLTILLVGVFIDSFFQTGMFSSVGETDSD